MQSVGVGANFLLTADRYVTQFSVTSCFVVMAEVSFMIIAESTLSVSHGATVHRNPSLR